MSTITLENWYQVDFTIVGSPKNLLKKISNLVDILKSKNLTSKWFFLYEGQTIRLRFRTTDADSLAKEIEAFSISGKVPIPDTHKFERYFEDQAVFDNPRVMEAFANIMSEVTDITIEKLKENLTFSNYTLLKTFSHCIFDTIYGLPIEPYLLLKRLGYKIDDKDIVDDPEQTILSSVIDLRRVDGASINTSLQVPVKKRP
jgi:hypothetical protein